MAQQKLKEGRKDVLLVDPRNIEVEKGFNVRDNYGDIQQLKASIKKNGLKVPLRGHRKKGEKEKYILTDGHRRTVALQELAKEGTVIPAPFLLEIRGYDEVNRTLDLVVCNDGKSLDPIEESQVYSRLIGLGLTEKDIVQRTGKSAAYVNNLLKLPDAPKEIQDMIKGDELSATLAVKILRENKNPEEAVKLLKAAQSDLQSVIGVRGRKNSNRITQKAVDKAKENSSPKALNSVSELKKFLKQTPIEAVEEDKQDIYTLLESITLNEVKIKDIVKFFNKQ